MRGSQCDLLRYVQLLLYPLVEPRHVDDHALVSPITDGLAGVAGFDTERQCSALDGDELGGRTDSHANRGRGEMADIEMNTETLETSGQQVLDRGQRRRLDDIDHDRSCEHGYAAAAHARRCMFLSDDEISEAGQSHAQHRQIHWSLRLAVFKCYDR